MLFLGQAKAFGWERQAKAENYTIIIAINESTNEA